MESISSKSLLRGIRRHHQQRRKQAVKRIYSNWFSDLSGRDLLRAVGRFAANRGVCSCPSCGNPRRHKLTGCQRSIQELRLFQREFD